MKFFQRLDHCSLREGSGKSRDNMKMISNAADAQRVSVQVAADRRDVGVHARTNVAIEPWFAIFGAEDNVNDDLAERLRHCGIIAEKMRR